MYSRLIALFLLCAVTFGGKAAYAATAEEAKAFVNNVGQHVLQVLNAEANEAQKQKKLQQLFSQNVDMDWMGQFVLGRAWSEAAPEAQARYLAAYRAYLLARYTHNFTRYAGSDYTITDTVDTGEGNFTVAMRINSPHADQQHTSAGYRVSMRENGEFKITDIIVEGVSLITTQRSDFASVLQNEGLESLIGKLHKKAQGESQAKAR